MFLKVQKVEILIISEYQVDDYWRSFMCKHHWNTAAGKHAVIILIYLYKLLKIVQKRVLGSVQQQSNELCCIIFREQDYSQIAK